MSRDAGKLRVGGILPELHSIHQVKILNAFHDGIFVKIPGYTHDGLIHHSQISRNLSLPLDMPKADRYRKINELVGDIEYQVHAKVVYVCDEPDHTKCECSLKMVRTHATLHKAVAVAKDRRPMQTFRLRTRTNYLRCKLQASFKHVRIGSVGVDERTSMTLGIRRACRCRSGMAETWTRSTKCGLTTCASAAPKERAHTLHARCGRSLIVLQLLWNKPLMVISMALMESTPMDCLCLQVASFMRQVLALACMDLVPLPFHTAVGA
jgi:predicted RNA-binding protein with RPS1 domain